MSEIILTERTLTFEYKSDLGVYGNDSNPSLFLPIEGEKYVIVWDGNEYTCVAFTAESNPGMVILGNALVTGGENTGEPFAMISIIDGSGMSIFTFGAEATHTVSVRHEKEEETKKGISIVLYDRTGAAVTYEGVETLTTDTPVEGETATFTHGELLEVTQIELNMAAGDQFVSVPNGYFVKEALLKKPETMLPEHIKKGVDIAGVVGTFAGDEQEKTVDLAMAAGDQVVEADENTVMTKVTIRKPETLLPENIADGVNIGGVIGSFKAVQAPHQLIDGSGESFEIIDESFDIPPVAVKSSAFLSNKGIAKVAMSEVREIGNSAFYSCPNLKEVSFEKCEIIGSNAFDRCYALESASFPACTEIKSAAFQWCSTIGKLELPNLVSCASYAFGSCSALAEINIEKMTSLPTGMFDYCANLSDIVFASEISYFGMYAIRGTAYYNNVAERLNNVVYVQNVAVSGLNKAITGTLSFKEGTTCVGCDGFYWYSKITKISCPTMKWIGDSAFRSCSSVTSVDMPGVLHVGNSAFQNCYKLASINFPNCSYVGSYAFQYGSSLATVNVTDCVYVGSNAFYNCSKMTTADLPICSYIGSYAFQNCYLLATINASECLYVGSSAFGNCSKISEVHLPMCSYIGSHAFQSCYSLTTAEFDMCKRIEGSAFNSCSALATISLPECMYIGTSAFRGCGTLKELYLPKCSYLSSYAFQVCSALEKIVLASTAVCTLVSSQVFLGTKIYSKTGYIYVPSSLVASYKAATNWKYFSTIISAIEDMEV